MRIVFEALGLIPGKTGGIETYVRNVVGEMIRIEPEHEYLIAIGHEAIGEFRDTKANIQEFDADGRHTRLFRTHRYTRTLHQCWQLHKRLLGWQPDALHCMMSFPKPPWGARNMVVTLHDIGMIDLASFWTKARPGLAGMLFRAAARKASALITVSSFAAERIADHFAVSPDRLHVVYNGVDHACFRRPNAAESGKLSGDVLQRYGLCPDFILYPAHTHHHKNHRTLFRALRVLAEEHGLRPRLVLTGAPGHAHNAVMESIAAQRLTDQVLWLGRVPREDLVVLYQSAAAMVFPSLYEGFGLPLVEAMACGCPVACSTTTATVEIAGDAAVTFDPNSPEAIAQAIFSVLTNSALRGELVASGLCRARQFSWDNTARRTLDVYRQVAS